MGTTTTHRTGSRAAEWLGRIARSGANALAALGSRTLHTTVDDVDVRSRAALRERLTQPLHTLRLTLSDDRGTLLIAFARREAVTLAGLAHPGRSDREILEQRLAPVVDPGSTDTLEDVGWLFAERGDRMLRAASGHRLGLEFVDVTMLSAANLGALLPGDRPVHVLRVRLEFDPIPATDVALLVDGSAFDTLDAAELGAGAGPATNRPPATMAEPVAARAAVVLHAFLTDDATFEIVRRCCAKVGLDVVRHAGATAPNPSALHGDIVLIDAPPGFDRRFEWCHRLKEGRPDLTVALLVPVPSRARVVRGFEARADAVIGWPIDPLDFALRLRKLGAPGSGSGG